MTKKLKEKVKAPVSPAPFSPWSGGVEIPIGQLVPTSWNVNEMGDVEFSELMAEIEDGGFDEPCQTVPIVDGDDAGKYLLIGGEHRFKAACALGMDVVPCVVKEHLDPDDEAALMAWSVKRNNIRGKINAQKFAELEMRVCKRRAISVEVARKQMLVRGEALKSLRKTAAIVENEDDSTEKGGRAPRTKDPSPTKGGKGAASGAAPTSASEEDFVSATSERQKLLANLRALEQQVLLESGDTIEHGYLFFGQGGSNHLVVEESPSLYGLVDRMVSLAKRESAQINEFLTSAITNELKNWE